jgi:exopolyphosphatase/guanosine-5'-triphosphate,3'-diphosphate pyrophosphatase
MKIAAVDLGSNSVHMVIVEVAADGRFHVIGREKEMVRLGERTLSRGKLSARAMERGLRALSKFQRLAQNHGVERILAVATSAVREAVNGEAFVARVGAELGFWPRVVSGETEARLIHLAAAHSVHLEGRPSVVIDIGGGSVELALGVGENVSLAVSERAGVLRLSEHFVKSDPLSAADEASLEAHVRALFDGHLARIKRHGFERVVGTSGTVLCLGALAWVLETGREPEALHHLTVKAESVAEVRRMLTRSAHRDRVRLPGVGESRADIVVAGAVVLDTLLSRLGASRLVLCEWALREGILLDYLAEHRTLLAQVHAFPDVRRRSVQDLAERCHADAAHGAQVARLALQLFDATRARHQLTPADRALLEHAALLHDIGHHISYPGHHKHGYYLVKNGDLRGFSPEEVELIASLVRYHRRSTPRRRHESWERLTAGQRAKLPVLAGLLRVAEALDRSHRQVVRGVGGEMSGRRLTLTLELAGDGELEKWALAQRADLLARSLDVKLDVRSVRRGPELVLVKADAQGTPA